MVDDEKLAADLRRFAQRHSSAPDPSVVHERGRRLQRRRRVVEAVFGVVVVLAGVVGVLASRGEEEPATTLDVVVPSTSTAAASSSTVPPESTTPSPTSTAGSSAERSCAVEGVTFDVPLGWLANRGSGLATTCRILRPKAASEDIPGFFYDLQDGDPVTGPLTVASLPQTVTATLWEYTRLAGWDDVVIEIADGRVRTIPAIDGVSMRLLGPSETTVPIAVAATYTVRRPDAQHVLGQVVSALVFGTADPSRVVVISSFGAQATSPNALADADKALASIAATARRTPGATVAPTTTVASDAPVRCTIQQRVVFDVPAGWSTNIETDNSVRSCLGVMLSARPGRAEVPRTFTYASVFGDTGFDNVFPVATMIAPEIREPEKAASALILRLRSMTRAIGVDADVRVVGGRLSISPEVAGLEWRQLDTALSPDATVVRLRHPGLAEGGCPDARGASPVESLLVGYADHWFLEIAPTCGVYTDGLTQANVGELLDAIAKTLRPA